MLSLASRRMRLSTDNLLSDTTSILIGDGPTGAMGVGERRAGATSSTPFAEPRPETYLTIKPPSFPLTLLCGELSNGEEEVVIEMDSTTHERGLTSLKLALLIFFMVVGGPFGIESTVGSAGPLVTIIGLVVVIFAWLLPQALISIELSLMMDKSGGPVVWVARAFGPFVGFVNAGNIILTGMVSLAMNFVLLIDYVPIKFTYTEDLCLRFAFSFTMAGINIMGTDWISQLSVVFLILIFSPFVAVLGLDVLYHQREILDFSKLLHHPPLTEIAWSAFVSTLIWCNDGLDRVGSFAGEIRGGYTTYFYGMAAGFPLIVVNYLVPIIIFYLPLPIFVGWGNNYFVDLSYKMNTWLGRWMMFSAALSTFGASNAGLASASRNIWAMSTPTEGGLQFLPSIMAHSLKSSDGMFRPVAAILFASTCAFCLSFLNFTFLAQLFLVSRIVSLLSQQASFVYLRFTEPSAPRPWRVPGGALAYFLPLPTLILGSIAVLTAPAEVLVSGGIAIGVIVALACLFVASSRYFGVGRYSTRKAT